MNKPVLEMKSISKRFGSVVALNKVDLTVYPGEIRGLIGENGSGKSTISSIAAGMQKANEGQMFFKGNKWEPESMIDALNGGIGMVVQESGTISGVSVAENMFLAELGNFKNGFGLVDRKKLESKAGEALANIGIDSISGKDMMGSLDFQDRKLVEIAKVIMKNPEVLVIDETSTALSHDGRQIMYDLIKQMRDNDKSVLFISHDLDEIMETCDSLTVLRDGNIIRTFNKDEFDADAIRSSMIGRELKGDYYRADAECTALPEVALSAEHLWYKDMLKDISLELHRGEIVGVGGLASSGMHALGEALFGAITLDSGRVVCSSGKVIQNPHNAMGQKIGYVSKDRDQKSLCLDASIRDNIAIAGMNIFKNNLNLLTTFNEKKYVKKQVDDLNIKCSDMDQTVSQLSGGNKQKVVFGKWIGCGSEILILDCPTRGVDIGVKQAMYQLMVKLKNEGKAILMISEEMPELIGMSDRVLIMKDGIITKQFKRSGSLSEADIISYMI